MTRMLPSVRQLQYLVALADHVHFTRAAEACFVSQSTLSAGLRELESLLGCALAERDRQTVLLTAAGEAAAQRARAILAANHDLVAAISQLGAPLTGLLRLGVIPTIAPFLLPPLLATLQKTHAALQLALREDLTAPLLARLRDGWLEFCVIALPFDTGELLVEPLFADPLCLVGRSDDPLLQSQPTACPSAERVLLLEEGHCLRNHALAACALGSPRRAPGLEATSLLTLIAMLNSGLGVGLLPTLAIQRGALRHTELVAASLPPPPPTRTVALIARPTTARFRDFQQLAQIIRAVQSQP